MSRWGDDWTKIRRIFPGGRTQIMSYVATSKVPTLENVLSIGARLIEKTGGSYLQPFSSTLAPPIINNKPYKTRPYLQRSLHPDPKHDLKSLLQVHSQLLPSLPQLTPLCSLAWTQLTPSSRSTWPPKQPSLLKQHAP
jgi:hypothetical protein